MRLPAWAVEAWAVEAWAAEAWAVQAWAVGAAETREPRPRPAPCRLGGGVAPAALGLCRPPRGRCPP